MTVISVPREERIKRIRATFIMLVWTAARQFSQELQEFGLTLPQFVALAALVAHKHPCTMSDLTKVTVQDAPTMTGIMDRSVSLRVRSSRGHRNWRRATQPHQGSSLGRSYARLPGYGQ